MTIELPSSQWRPGDPLYSRGVGNYVRPIIQVIEETDTWLDAASWPEPGSRALSDGDELGRFIEQYHEWQRGGAA